MPLTRALGLGLLLLTTAAAAPAKKAARACEVQTGTSPPTFQPNLNSPSAEDVVNAVTAWLNDVCTVDSFLNNPVGGPTALDTVIAFAVDEPNHLKTLAALPDLSQAGRDAAAALEANFPSIPANLDNLASGAATAALATTAINFNRCCIVLPSIDTLVREAAAVSGAFADEEVPSPMFPDPCGAIDCSSGLSAGAASS